VGQFEVDAHLARDSAGGTQKSIHSPPPKLYQPLFV